MVIHENMLVSDVIALVPEAETILSHYQLGCGSCSMSHVETLGEGLMAHGYDSQEIAQLVEDLNNRAVDYEKNISAKGVFITPTALEKLDFFATEFDKIGYGIMIKRTIDEDESIKYTMDFQEELAEDQIQVDYQGKISLFIEKKDEEIMKGVMIDFIESLEGQGFKVTNPNDSK